MKVKVSSGSQDAPPVVLVGFTARLFLLFTQMPLGFGYLNASLRLLFRELVSLLNPCFSIRDYNCPRKARDYDGWKERCSSPMCLESSKSHSTKEKRSSLWRRRCKRVRKISWCSKLSPSISDSPKGQSRSHLSKQIGFCKSSRSYHGLCCERSARCSVHWGRRVKSVAPWSVGFTYTAAHYEFSALSFRPSGFRLTNTVPQTRNAVRLQP